MSSFRQYYEFIIILRYFIRKIVLGSNSLFEGFIFSLSKEDDHSYFDKDTALYCNFYIIILPHFHHIVIKGK